GAGRAGGVERGHLVRHHLSRPDEQHGGLLLRRVRASQFGADLLGRPGDPGRGPVQSRVRLGRAAGRRRAALHAGLLRSAPPTGRLAGGRRRAIRRVADTARTGARSRGRSVGDRRADRRSRGGRGRLAGDGRARAGVPARHRPGAERPRRPGAVAPAVRRGARPQDAAGGDRRCRGRAGVAGTGPIWEEMRVSRDAVLRLGHHPVRDHGQFHMPVLAMRLSQQVNGVARRHGEESRRMWAGLWPGRDPTRVPIGHVTNGVHLATWMSHRMTDLLNAHLGPDWPDRVDEPGFWDSVLGLETAAVWETHRELKGTLLRAIRDDARRRRADQWKEALHLVGAGTLLEERALTIAVARRFATYKRASLT